MIESGVDFTLEIKFLAVDLINQAPLVDVSTGLCYTKCLLKRQQAFMEVTKCKNALKFLRF